MKRGTKKKPKAINDAEGNPGKREQNDNQPVYSSRATPPSNLSAAAKREWKRLGPLLHEWQLLSDVDRNAFAEYCEAWAKWCVAVAGLTQAIDDMENGIEDADRRVSLYKQLWAESSKQTQRGVAHFGLSPAERNNIKSPVAGKNREADLDSFLKNKPELKIAGAG